MSEQRDPAALKSELKRHVIKHLNLEGRTESDIADDMPLLGEGLGLDSIDALELIVMLERHYGIRVLDPKKGREVFSSINTMAEHILAQP